jgi:hypothetical protein
MARQNRVDADIGFWHSELSLFFGDSTSRKAAVSVPYEFIFQLA